MLVTLAINIESYPFSLPPSLTLSHTPPLSAPLSHVGVTAPPADPGSPLSPCCVLAFAPC